LGKTSSQEVEYEINMIGRRAPNEREITAAREPRQ
jgi:hypothetical protein